MLSVFAFDQYSFSCVRSVAATTASLCANTFFQMSLSTQLDPTGKEQWLVVDGFRGYPTYHTYPTCFIWIIHCNSDRSTIRKGFHTCSWHYWSVKCRQSLVTFPFRWTSKRLSTLRLHVWDVHLGCRVWSFGQFRISFLIWQDSLSDITHTICSSAHQVQTVCASPIVSGMETPI